MNLPLNPLRDSITAPTFGDRVAHLITRLAFLAEFTAWERAHELERKWSRDRGFTPAIQDFADAMDRLARAAGYVDRSSLAVALKDETTLEVVRECSEEVEREIQEVWWRAACIAEPYNIALDALRETGVAQLMNEAQDFVCSLGLPWPWLATELVENFIQTCFSFPYGVKYCKGPNRTPPQDVLKSELKLEITLEAGQPVEQALARVEQELEHLKSKLNEQRTPLGRLPKKSQEVLERNARWFFRNKVLGHSYRQIARDAFPDADFPDDRKKDVKQGIERAQYFLEMAAYRYCKGEDGSYINSPRGVYAYTPNSLRGSLAPGGDSPF